MARAPLPPTRAPPSSATARSRTRSTVASPASVLVSATGRTLTRAAPSRPPAGPGGGGGGAGGGEQGRRRLAEAQTERGHPEGDEHGQGGQGDEQPGVAEAPQERPPQKDEGEQAHGHGAAAGHHGPPGGGHGPAYRLLAVVASDQLLPP